MLGLLPRKSGKTAKTLLKAEQNMGAGPVTALLFNDKRMAITLDQKPRVQNSKGQNFIVKLDRSLKSLSPTGGTSKTFEFTVDDKIQPTLKVTDNDGKEHLFTWNPTSLRIISQDDWNYKIEPGKEPNDYAAITRTNTNKQREAKGQETDDGCKWRLHRPSMVYRRTSIFIKTVHLSPRRRALLFALKNGITTKAGRMYRNLISTAGKGNPAHLLI